VTGATDASADDVTEAEDTPEAPDGEDTPDTSVPLSPRSLVIALDGVRPDAMAQAATPTLDALIGGTLWPGYHGAYTPTAQNLTDADTVSGPNHAAIMTGATGSQHGVTGNHDVWMGDFDTYPHYLSLLETADPDTSTACLFTWFTDAEIPSGADFIKNASDQDNVDALADVLATDVDAVFLFLDDPDHAGHSHGFEPGVGPYLEELASVDAQIGTLLATIAARPTFAQESWQIVITSDHGGYHGGHGGGSAPEHTIPFLVAGRDVLQGRLPSGTRIFDVTPTVLDHMGVPIPELLTGSVRGDTVTAPDVADLTEGLAVYYRFDGDLSDSSGAELHATIGANADVAPTVMAGGGKFGGHLKVDDPGGDGASYVSLGTPPALDMGADQPFSVTLWFRSHGTQGGDPVIVGNKDWDSGFNAGWVMLANEGGDNSFGANFGSGADARVDLEDIDYTDTQWWFLGVTYDPEGLALMVAGDAGGVMRWMALETAALDSLVSTYPLNIGQDGTGAYPHNLAADLDDLAIWRRALSMDELNVLYSDGVGAPVVP